MDSSMSLRGFDSLASPEGLAAGAPSGLALADKDTLTSVPQAPALSLPKGGGAIRSIGEKFDVNLMTGTGSASFPLQTSPARSNVQPQLSFSYDSGEGNSEFGLGWRMNGTGSISRKISRGLPRYEDGGAEDSDVFLFSGAEDLVPLFKRDGDGKVVLNERGKPIVDETPRGSFMVRKYLPRVTQSLSRIERWTNLKDTWDIHWRIISTDNRTTIYGRDSNSRIYDPGSVASTTSRIFSWLEAEAFDSRGNAMIFTYKPEDSVNVDISASNSEASRSAVTRTANRYLKCIRYGNTVPNRSSPSWQAFSAFDLPAHTWRFAVVFDYGEHNSESPKPEDAGLWRCRLDPFSTYHAGYEVRTYRLCQRILMFHFFSELGADPFLVRSTDITYSENATTSYLVSAQGAGYAKEPLTAGYIKRVLPPLTFEYSKFPSDDEIHRAAAKDFDEESLRNIPFGIDGSKYSLTDLDGEGLPGILAEQGSSWFYKRNSSANNLINAEQVAADIDAMAEVEALFGPLGIVSTKPVGGIAAGQLHLSNITGAGALDLVQASSGCWGYYERDMDTEEGWTTFHPFPSAPTVDIAHPNVKLIDLTGDGLADILICGDQLQVWYPSLGALGYGAPQSITQSELAVGDTAAPVCIASDTEHTVFFADMSGDGLADIVRIRNGDVCYWPNCGYGRFGTIVRMDNAPYFDTYGTYDGTRIRLGDVDGSGTTDIIYLGATGVDMYMNQAGNGFADSKELVHFPMVDNVANVTLTDLLGNGTNCIVWSTPLPGPNGLPLRYLDIMGGRKPHLLTRMTNNIGSEQHIAYAPSTKFYLQDREEGTHWLTKLPFPVQCVEKVVLVDHIGRNRFVNRFRYHHGHFDGVEREFRGFASVEKWDTDEFSVSEATTLPDVANMEAAWHVPPAHTKTWFHTGACAGADNISRGLAAEYFGAPVGGSKDEMSAFLNTVLPDTVVPDGVLDGDVLREACRALKGHVLRVEIYADDGGPKSQIPYSVQEANFTIDILQPVQDGHQHSIFTVHPRETIDYHYERILGDPRVQHDLVLQTDKYGNPLKQLQIAYGRQQGKSSLTGPDKEKQETTRFLFSENEVTKLVDERDDYRIPIPWETRSYEVSGLELAAGHVRYAWAGLVKDGFAWFAALAEIQFEEANIPGLKQKRLLSRSRRFFRKDDLTALLPPGTIGTLGLPGVDYEMWTTPGLLTKVYQRRRPNQPVENLLPDPEAVLGQQGGYVDLDNDGRWWTKSGRVFYHSGTAITPSQELQQAQTRFFQPVSFVDPFGGKSTVEYDSYLLFPVSVQDPVGNKTSTLTDYRVLLPVLSTDLNGNQRAVRYDALGTICGTALMGKPKPGGGHEGDSFDNFKPDLSQTEIDQFFANPRGPLAMALLGSATTRVIADPLRYWNGGQGLPTYEALVSRETHASALWPNENLKFQVVVNYSDGLGQAVQTKAQAKDGPLTDKGPPVINRWVTTSWTIHNNKGLPVRHYEPFFDDTHEFKYAVTIGKSPIMLYDPLSRPVATLYQDHSLEHTIFDAWSETHFDANDNVRVSNPKDHADIGHLFELLPESDYLPSWYDARSQGQLGPAEKQAAVQTEAHSNTPSTAHIDALGHKFISIEDNGGNDLHVTRSKFDITGQLRSVTDPLNRPIVSHDYCLAGHAIHGASMEAGESWTLPDVTGKAFLAWDSRGFRSISSYDVAQRLTQVWVQDKGEAAKLVLENTYGESLADAQVKNLRGRISRVRDQAGEARPEAYDFKGNVTSTVRIFARDYKTTLDWSQTVALETEAHTSSYIYDAMSRAVQTVSPDGTVTRSDFNAGGHMEQLHVDILGQHQNDPPSTLTPIITSTDHNAKSQIKTTSYGNGTLTQRTYDPLFSHLTRIQSTRTNGDVLQDLGYTYDAIGNMTRQTDQAQQDIFFRNNRVQPGSSYTYDPLYRLKTATGREHLGQTGGRPVAPGPDDIPNDLSPTDGGAMGNYLESYVYDAVGNILSIAHAGSDPQNPGWTRTFTYAEDSQLEPGRQHSNRLSSSSVGATSEIFTYDEHGNMTSMSHVPLMVWDFHNQLRATSKQMVTNGGTPETTYYVYDGNGKRVRKVTERQAGPGVTPVPMKETLYVDGLERFRAFAGNGIDVTRQLVELQVHDGPSRIAVVETQNTNAPGGIDSGDGAVRFELGNNIGSVALQLDAQGRLLSYEEYFPFGATAYRGVTSDPGTKRYRHAAKERDDESGLYYYGARYQAPWLARWVSPDPSGLAGGGPNLYEFVRGNPIVLTDPDGRQPGLGPGLTPPGGPPPVHPEVVRRVLERGTGEVIKDVGEAAVEKGVERTVLARAAGAGIAPALAGINVFLIITLWPANWRDDGSFERELIEQDRLRKAAERQKQQQIEAPGAATPGTVYGPPPPPGTVGLPPPQGTPGSGKLPAPEGTPTGAPVVPEQGPPVEAAAGKDKMLEQREEVMEKARKNPYINQEKVEQKNSKKSWDPEWHHSIPQDEKVSQRIPASIDINAPENGRVLPAWYHRLISHWFMLDWRAFIESWGNRPIPVSAVLEFQRKMDRKWGTGKFQRPTTPYDEKIPGGLKEEGRKKGWLKSPKRIIYKI
ncbi:hypothetical protein IL306_004502 [Fusarium sp. DS 682]|nr:hypothetical protein IL306_004502 [Fusarium sp. DS 682]